MDVRVLPATNYAKSSPPSLLLLPSTIAAKKTEWKQNDNDNNDNDDKDGDDDDWLKKKNTKNFHSYSLL